MDTYSTIDFQGEFRGPLTSQNGELNHKLAGVDNPAFLSSERHTVPTGSLAQDFLTNHLVYRQVGESEYNTNDFNNIFSNSSHANAQQLNYATVRPAPIIGYTLKSVSAKGALSKPHTLSRSSALMPAVRTHPVGTISRTTLSRHYSGTEIRSAISFFEIEIDKASSYQYRPGEEVSGDVVIMVRKSVEIRFVELVVTGQGHVVIRKPGDGFPHTARETYLHKEKCIIGSHDVLLSSVLTPGHYTSKFRVKLPKDLPSTIRHEDAANRFTFDISFSIKVRICDDAGIAPHRHPSSRANMVRVLLEKQVNFNVQRGFDLNTIPDAMSPIMHSEQVYLSCNHQQAAIVSVSVDRAVFLAGDDIRMKLEVSLPSSQSVKEITCNLQEVVTINPKNEPTVFILAKIVRKDPHYNSGQLSNQKQDQDIFDLTMPTNTGLISPYSLGNSKIKVGYFLEIEIRFTPAGGKLSFKVPIGMGPCAEPMYAEKIFSNTVVPLFNRPTRFPCFSSRPLPGSSTLRRSLPRSAASVEVTTKYSNGLFARCLLCCMGSDL